jgi:hypothetical protein
MMKNATVPRVLSLGATRAEGSLKSMATFRPPTPCEERLFFHRHDRYFHLA